MLRFLILSIVSLLLLAPPAQAAEPLHVVTLDAPPMVIPTEAGLGGMAVELAQEGLKRAGYAPDIELMPWKRAIFMAKEGRADALFYAVLNKERTRFFHYPDTPLFTIQIAALKRTGTAILINPQRTGLSRWTLGLGRGFSYGRQVQEFIDTAKFKRIEEATSNDINVDKLLDSRIDLMVVDRVLGKSFIDRYPGKLEFVSDEHGDIAILSSRPAYFVFSKITRTAEDAKRFSEAIRSMKQDGTYEAITSRYQ